MVAPLLGKSALLLASRMGTVAGPALLKATVGPAGGAARSACMPAVRQAALGLAPRAANVGQVARELSRTLAPRAALPSPLRKTGTEFCESAATDAFSQLTGITAKTSPSLGGAVYEAAKFAAAAADTSGAVPPRIATPHAALARLVEGTKPLARDGLTHSAFAPLRTHGDGPVIGSSALQALLDAAKNGS